VGLLFFSHLCNPVYLTGAEKQLLLLIRELKPYASCTLVVPNDGIIAAEARAEGIPVRIVPVPVIPAIHKALPDPQAAIEAAQQGAAWQALVRLLLAEKPDAVFVNTTAHPLPAAAARGLGIPVVWAVTEIIEPNDRTAQAAMCLDRYADLIVGASQTALRPFLAIGQEAKTEVLYPSWRREELEPESWPALRTQVREELGVSGTQRLVAYISSAIYPGKGLDHFMRMAAAVAARRPDAIFLVVGTPADDAYMEHCLSLVRSADPGLLEQRFRFIRFEQRLGRLYPAMDIVVIPSVVEEGFGTTAAEGMAFGKPVVSYAAGGLAEIHQATGNAELMAPVGDVAELTAKVEALLEDTGLQEGRFGRNAAAAEAAFGLEAFRQRLEKIRLRLPLLPAPAQWLLRGSGRTVYRWEDGRLRPFASETAFLAAGHSFADVREAADAVLRALPAGPPIGGRSRVRTAGARLRLRRVRRRLRLRRGRAVRGHSVGARSPGPAKRRKRTAVGGRRAGRGGTRASAARARGLRTHRRAAAPRGRTRIAAGRGGKARPARARPGGRRPRRARRRAARG